MADPRAGASASILGGLSAATAGARGPDLGKFTQSQLDLFGLIGDLSGGWDMPEWLRSTEEPEEAGLSAFTSIAPKKATDNPEEGY